MSTQRYLLLLAAVATGAAISVMLPTPSAAEPEKPAASIPNFTRVWNHPAFPWFEPPASGPGPITNLSRWPVQRGQPMGGSLGLPPSKEGIANYDQMVG